MDEIKPTKKGFFQKAGMCVDDSVYQILIGLSSIIFALAGLFISSSDILSELKEVDGFKESAKVIFTDIWGYLIVIGVISLIVGAVGNSREITRLKNNVQTLLNSNRTLKNNENVLKEKIEEAEQELVETKAKIRGLNLESIAIWLKVYSKQLGLKNTDRVSLYYEDNKILHILSRYSANPKLNEIHKQKFPLDKGVISEAWEMGVCYKQIREGYSNKPDEYIQHCRDTFGYDENEIKSLTMKSQLYFAKAIKDADDHIGIIIFESYDPELLNEDKRAKIEEFLDSSSSLLTNLIRASKNFDQEMMNKTPSNATMTDEEELLQQASEGG